jgi:hypothetical protein
MGAWLIPRPSHATSERLDQQAPGCATVGRGPGRTPADERDDELQRLLAKVGEITIDNELLLERCHRLEADLPLA